MRFSLLGHNSFHPASANHTVHHLRYWTQLLVTFQPHSIPLCVWEFKHFFFFFWILRGPCAWHSAFHSFEVSFSFVFLFFFCLTPILLLPDYPWAIHILLILLFRAICLFHCWYYKNQGFNSNGSARQRTLQLKRIQADSHLRKDIEANASVSPQCSPCSKHKILTFKFKGSACSSPAQKHLIWNCSCLPMFLDWLWLTK